MNSQISPKDLLKKIKTHYPKFHKNTVKVHRKRLLSLFLCLIPLLLLVFSLYLKFDGTLLLAEYKLSKNTTVVEKVNKDGENGISIKGDITYVSGPNININHYNTEEYKNCWINKNDCVYLEEENKLYIDTDINEIVCLYSFVFGFFGIVVVIIMSVGEFFDRDWKGFYLGIFSKYLIEEDREILYSYTIPSTFEYFLINIKEFFGYEITYEDVLKIYNSVDFIKILLCHNEKIAEYLITSRYSYRLHFFSFSKNVETEINYLEDYCYFIKTNKIYDEKYRRYLNILEFDYDKYNTTKKIL
jgi:hypothetical protein